MSQSYEDSTMGLFLCHGQKLSQAAVGTGGGERKRKVRGTQKFKLRTYVIARNCRKRQDCAWQPVFKLADKNPMCCFGKDTVPAYKRSQAWEEKTVQIPSFFFHSSLLLRLPSSHTALQLLHWAWSIRYWSFSWSEPASVQGFLVAEHKLKTWPFIIKIIVLC